MKNKLEQLLNSLVKLGWKPYGISRVKNVTLLNRYVSFSKRTILGIEFFEYTLRGLVSKESGLWQFVCENGLTALQVENNNTQSPQWRVRYHWNKHSNTMQEDERLSKERKRNENYEYRLIESSLRDEDKLEEFLLSNIKI